MCEACAALYELKPAAIACDMHPDHMSTECARASTPFHAPPSGSAA